MVKIKYIGHWQPHEVKDVDTKKAKSLVDSGDWEYTNIRKPKKIIDEVKLDIEETDNANSKRTKKRSTTSSE